MVDKPQVAIMMPVFNGEKTLPLAVASLLHQTYSYWKCYIVNDGSTDGTKAYLNSLTDDRFVITHFEKNRGRPYARQAALDVAQGKYLAFLDADDFYHPEKLEKQVSQFEDIKDLALVSCIMASYDSNYTLYSTRPYSGFHTPKLYSYSDDFRPSRAGSMVILNDAKMVGYDLGLKFAQDTDFFERYLNEKTYNVINEVLYYYSEFDSVTGVKIVETYNFKLKRILKKFKSFPVKVIFHLIIWLIKYLIIRSLVLVGLEKILLKNRGNNPSKEDTQQFNKIIKCLKK